MADLIRLTHKIIDELRPETKPYSVRDTESRGLCITVTPTGHKAFAWVGRSQGKSCRKTIGAYPDIALERARKIARRILGDVSQGLPATVKAIDEASLTLEDVFEWWHRNHAIPKTSDAAKIRRRFDNSFKEWRSLAIDEITSAMVQEFHVSTGSSRGRMAANEAVKMLRQLFECASNRLNWPGRNPTKGLMMFPREERERYLLADELPAFFAAVQGLQSQTAKDMIMLCLWTGARRGNVAAMEWPEIAGDVWSIPRSKAKTKKAMRIILVPQAIAILERRKPVGGRFVFPSRAASGHYKWPKTSWKTLTETLELHGITNLRMHDLRRTLGSWQAAAGASEIVIGKSLGHASTSQTKVYTRLQLDPVRKSVTVATSDIEAAANKKNETASK